MDGSASNGSVQFQASLAALSVSEERRARSGRSGHQALPPEIPTYWRLEESPSATIWPLTADFPLPPPPPQPPQRREHVEYQPHSRSAPGRSGQDNYNYHYDISTSAIAPAVAPAAASASTYNRDADYHYSDQGFLIAAQSETPVPVARQNAVRENYPPPASNSRRARHRGRSRSRSSDQGFPIDAQSEITVPVTRQNAVRENYPPPASNSRRARHRGRSRSRSRSSASASRRARRLQRQSGSQSIRENAQHWLASPSPAGRPTGIGAAPGVPVGLNEPLPLPTVVLGRAKDSLRVRRKTPLQSRQDEERKKRQQQGGEEGELGESSTEHTRQMRRRGYIPSPSLDASSSSSR